MSQRDPRILLVEDNPDDADLTLRAFAKSGIKLEIDVVRDGAEALDYLYLGGAYASRDPAGLPALILLDLHLPKVDGLDVLQRLRSDDRTRRLPIVVLTSSSEESDIVRSYEFGANSFVCKPVDFGQLIQAAAQLGLYWLVLNEPSPR